MLFLLCVKSNNTSLNYWQQSIPKPLSTALADIDISINLRYINVTVKHTGNLWRNKSNLCLILKRIKQWANYPACFTLEF